MQEPGTERQGGRAKGNSRQQSQPKRPKETGNPNRKPPGGDSVRAAYKAAWRSDKAISTHQGTVTQNCSGATAHKRDPTGTERTRWWKQVNKTPNVPKPQNHGTKRPSGEERRDPPPGPPPRGARKKSSPQRTPQRTQETVRTAPTQERMLWEGQPRRKRPGEKAHPRGRPKKHDQKRCQPAGTTPPSPRRRTETQDGQQQSQSAQRH